jgi:ATP-dependent RNA circularization protein (DNA/RNA ligase family)
MYEAEKNILPEFPRTLHLPLEPNAQSDDKIASDSDMYNFLSKSIVVQEKIDGASMGVSFYNGEPMVRNRSHILRKGYSARKTPAQQQFSRAWTWLYENCDKIKEVSELVGSQTSIFGEWLVARHTVAYDALPDWFVAYDIYDADAKKFLDPSLALEILETAGFATIKVIDTGIQTPTTLLAMRDGKSAYNNSEREGIYLKSGDGQWCTGRYKMVAPWFKSDDNWNKKPLVKNACVR